MITKLYSDMQSTMTPWVGQAIAPSKRILILGESWYGEHADMSDYVKGWCAFKRDYLFSRIFNAASGFHTSTATKPERQNFWDKVLFDNFVNFSVGMARSHRPNTSQYVAASASFPSRLDVLRPDAVWVLGKEQSMYSSKHLTKYHCIFSPHPCGWGVKTAKLQTDWNDVCAADSASEAGARAGATGFDTSRWIL